MGIRLNEWRYGYLKDAEAGGGRDLLMPLNEEPYPMMTMSCREVNHYVCMDEQGDLHLMHWHNGRLTRCIEELVARWQMMNPFTHR